MRLRPYLGLTLGGGGARGGAHIGVLRVLEELGYKPDIVVGTSIGGLVATLIGTRRSAQQIEAVMEETNFNTLLQIDRTGKGLIGSEVLDDQLRHLFGDADLRDLSPRVAVVAADIAHSQRVMIDRGPVVKAVLATMAVPGLFPPIVWGDRVLVDGGIISNVPTQATYQLGADRVVAVDLGEDMDLGLALNDVGSFSKQLERTLYWLLSLSRRQAAFDTMIRATMLSYRMLAQYELKLFPPDVLIRPEVHKVGLFSMEQVLETIEIGEQAAIDQARRIQAVARRPFRAVRRRSYQLPDILCIGTDGAASPCEEERAPER